MEMMGIVRSDNPTLLLWGKFVEIVRTNDWTITKSRSYNCTLLDEEVRNSLDIDAEWINKSGTVHEIIFTDGKAVAHIDLNYGSVTIQATGATREDVKRILNIAIGLAPQEEPADDSIYVTFWAHGSHGPSSNRRKLDVPKWDDIQVNYHEPTRIEIGKLMNTEFRPKKSGQLLLWHGEPGTGKTTALRAMGYAWREWCEVHYVTDPEKFFGSHADYMMQVMTQATDKWRLLVMEDTGEFLTVDARQQMHSSQGLSRFLNAMDGLLGQGLDFTCLVTTNEEIKKMHPAVIRPGRSLSITEFKPLIGEEVVKWADHHQAELEKLQGPTTIAELFSMMENDEVQHLPKTTHKSTVGFG